MSDRLVTVATFSTDLDAQLARSNEQDRGELGGPDPPSAPAEEDTPRCLVCQSSLVAFREPPLLLRIVRGLVLQVVPLPPQWFESRRRACGVCGHEWQEEP